MFFISFTKCETQTTIKPQVTPQLMRTSALWEGRNKSFPHQLKEAIFIGANDPSLNRNIGEYHMPCIGDEVLLYTPERKTLIEQPS